jgi:RNA polymerase sigma factor (sigma-70 family)
MRRDDDTLEDSFVDFVRTRSDHHRRVAVLLAGEWHAGQDLLQASLVKLYRAWPRIDTSSGADAYLHRIMVNQQNSWWRTKWRREIPVDQFPEPGYAEDPAGRYADGRLIRAALARLPHRQRAVLVLRYFADLPEAEWRPSSAARSARSRPMPTGGSRRCVRTWIRVNFRGLRRRGTG